RVRLARPGETADARHEALDALAEAESLFGRSPVLEVERRRHREALGLADDSQSGAAPVPRTAWEACALGRASLAAGDLTTASTQLEHAVRMQPQGLWPNFYHGVCAYRMGRYEDAALAFSVCVGAAPDLAAAYSNRALALAALGRTSRAVADC